MPIRKIPKMEYKDLIAEFTIDEDLGMKKNNEKVRELLGINRTINHFIN